MSKQKLIPIIKCTSRNRVIHLTVIAVGLMTLVPFVLNDYQISLGTEVMIFALYALGINVLLGYTGYVSLGHAMFLGIGGYGLAILSVLWGWPVWAAVPATFLIGAILGGVIGFACLRVGKIQFLVLTLAFSQMLSGAFTKLKATGGTDGMAGIPRPDLAWLGVDSWNNDIFYLYVLTFFLVVTFTLYRVLHSPFGSVLVGIRENERRMVALGYRTGRYKIGAFAISGFVATVAGLLLAQRTGFATPDYMSWSYSGEGILMVIIGGMQSFSGPILGAGFYVLAKAGLADITDEYIVVFGLLFMIVVAGFRTGLSGLIKVILTWRTRNERT
ncbi:branched-chain amino acid ABC transporter permease [Oceanospirillaceae bacterium]|nr:branched-chain amino acid ABC transporter permease [Oceanospirillaceae bacterium]|tara:strand:- start:1454 stop:2443 length:990 start_codon:yes stop_codon:yes gene_type:complete